MKTWKILLIVFIPMAVLYYFAWFHEGHLDEKVIQDADVKVKWYHTSGFSFGFEWVDIEKGWRSENVLRADFTGHSRGIDSVYIVGDTVIIRTLPYFFLYEFNPTGMGYHVRIDSTTNAYKKEF